MLQNNAFQKWRPRLVNLVSFYSPLQSGVLLNSTAGYFQHAGFGTVWISAYNDTGSQADLRAWLVKNGYGIYGEGPWIALICFGAIIVFFSFVGMILMCVTWAR